MQHHIRALGILTMSLALAAGCSSTSKSQRASQAPAPPPAVTTAPPARAPSTPVGLNPIPGHPPVTVSGIAASLDPATGRYATEWILDGAPSLDLSEISTARFAGRDVDEVELRERCRHAYATHYRS